MAFPFVLSGDAGSRVRRYAGKTRRWLKRVAEGLPLRRRATAEAVRRVIFEPLEPRLLLSADLYPLSFAMDAAAHDLTLRLQDVGGVPPRSS